MAIKKISIAAGVIAATLLTSGAMAAEGRAARGMPHLDHVFVIMMENHGYNQILNNPNAPFINNLAQTANLATNFFAVGHPSLTNYLEVVGGSNFGVLNDHSPDWHNGNCTPNIVSGSTSYDNSSFPAICPIAGVGTDAETVAIDTTNEVSGAPGMNNIDGTMSIPAESTVGKTIADQLVAHHKSWKSYQEGLPLSGADRVNDSDGFFTNNTDFSQIQPTLAPPLSQSDVVALYASKHNPFVYFKNVQEGTDPRNSLKNAVGFEGPHGLFADLARGHVPSFSFIAPSQCNDMHGRGNAGALCNYDPHYPGLGTQAGVNPALIYRGDVTVERIVTSIKASPAWRKGKNAIVILWDENDYALAPITNQIMVIVDTNYGRGGVKDNKFYTHYSLLKSIEAGFGLPCLNHACDVGTSVMSDMFRR